jgi:ParB family transcriptional regulator, chromosome partitioning protein
MTEPSELGRTLKRLRMAKGLSQGELARATKIPQSVISTLESGAQQSTDIGKLRALALALGCTVTELVGEAAPAAPPVVASDVQMLRLSDITPSPLNPRKSFDPDGLEHLADSIEAQGLLQNLVVRPADDGDGYQIVAGERRYRALSLLATRGKWKADEPTVPVKVIEADDAKHLAIALLENLQRHDVNAMEEAEAFAQLIALDPSAWSTKTIASNIGCTQRHIQQRLALLDKLGDAAQTALRDGKITFSQARVLTMATPDEQAKLVKSAATLPPAPQLRERLTGGLIPTNRAIFDLSAYPRDRMVENPDNGQWYFADSSLFMDLQRKAAQAKAEDLKGAWNWTRVVECHHFTPSHWAMEETNDPAQAGAVVHFQASHGHVTVHENLANCRSTEEEERNQRFAAQRAAQEETNRRVAEFRKALALAIANDPGAALLLLLTHQMRTPRHGADYDSWLLRDAHGKLDAALFRKSGPLDRLADLVDGGELKHNSSMLDAWTRLTRLPSVNLRQATESWIADRIHIELSRSGALHPIFVALARKHRIAIPACFNLGDQTDIEDAANAAPAATGQDAVVATVRCAPAPVNLELLKALGRALPQHEQYGLPEIILPSPDDLDDDLLLDASSSEDDEYYIIGLTGTWGKGLTKAQEGQRMETVIRHWIASVAPELLPADMNPVQEKAA